MFAFSVPADPIPTRFWSSKPAHTRRAPTVTECTPILPSQADVFSTPTKRAALRPTLAHNASTPTILTRRTEAEYTSNERDRPHTAGELIDIENQHQPQHVHQHGHQLSVLPPSASLAPPVNIHVENSHMYTEPIHSLNSSTSSVPSLNTSTTYSDELSFQTNSSFVGSYGSSGYDSPWPVSATIPHGQHLEVAGEFYQPGTFFPSRETKQYEPILAPGELPAPRPQLSYAALIGEALMMSAAPHQLYVSEIADSVKKRYACEYLSISMKNR